jgi:NAD(P)-dependent dehydrogenase (short-subunit alcohol dehydrogenase family)
VKTVIQMISMTSGRKVLITGAAGALGAAVAKRFIAAGDQVHGTFLGGKPPGESSVRWISCNLSDASSVRSELGTSEFDVLVHCAGGFRYSPVDSASDEDWDFLIDANLKSAFLVSRALLPGMKQRNRGKIVFVGSRATLAPYAAGGSAGMGPYAASKAGINMLTSSIADEVRAHAINVNAVLPSVIDTPVNRKDMPKSDPAAWVKPEALAEIIFSLTQPWSDPIHGALIPVSGRV